MSRLSFLLCSLLIFLLLGAGAHAQATATVSLARREIVLGEDVEMELRVQGGGRVQWQGAVQVEGLEISGPRAETMGFGNLGGGITLVFTIVPQREGTFTIPALSLAVDGRAVQTQPVVLKVLPEGSTGSRRREDQYTMGLLELVMPPGPFYVGQLIPLDIRLSSAAKLRWQPEAMPEVGGDGFTKLKFPEPKQVQEDRNGEALDVYIFRTAITPSKAGKLKLGPVEAPYAAMVPRQRPRGQRSLIDQFFGNDPAFGVMQHQKAQAAAIELDVKPLPAAGKPESFSGGIGNFVFVAEGAPARVKVGDPVTMKLTVKGSGNFDRLGAPVMKTTQGWRTYPPSAEFKASDEIGVSGTKTFSVAVVPEVRQTAMPVFEFSYFDPRAGKYVTLTSEPQSLVVEGAPAPPPVAVAESAVTPEKPAAEPAPASDIVGLRYEPGRVRHSFAPLYRQPAFWAAQTLPALALAGWLFSRRRRTSQEELQRRGWRREKAALVSKLRSAESDGDFLETAAQIIRLETAIATGREASSIDAATALRSRSVDAATAHGVERIFDTRAELLYAGTATGGARLSGEERQELLAVIQRFEKAHARR